MTHPAASTRTFLITLAFLLGATPGSAQNHLAITPVTVIDVADGSVRSDQTVLVGSNRITAVSPVDEVAVPEHAEVVDGADGYLIPGLWDMHVHSVANIALDMSIESVAAWEWHFPLFLAHGVTGVRNMNDGTGDLTLELANSVKRRVSEGKLAGPPRFLNSGPSLDGDPPFGSNSVVVRTAAEAQAAVAQLASHGADLIKPYENLSREAYFAIMDQARRRGVPVDGHVPFRVTAEEAAAAGQRTVEHPEVMAAGCSADAEAVRERFAGVLSDFDNLSEIEQFLVQFRLYRAFYETRDPAACATTIEAFLRHDVAVTMDLVAYHHVVHADEILADTTRMRLVPQAVRRNWEEQAAGEDFRQFQLVLRPNIPLELENTRLLRDAGVTLLAATDVGVPFQVPGISLHVELERLVEAGLTPFEALQTATVNPARVLGLDDSLGTVQAGKLADLILLDANPLDDIRNTQQIRAVVADGRLYGRAELDRLLAEVAAPVEQVDKQPLPVIDMHLHASSPDGFGGPQTVCTNRDEIEFPPVDPREDATVQKTSICTRPLMSAQDGEENARRTGELMRRHNIYGVLDVSEDGLEASLAHGDEWRRYAPGRYWTAIDFSDTGLPPLDELEDLVRQGRIQLFAEVSPQYDGERSTAERLEPYFVLAERLDVPIGLHLGEGPPGGTHVMPGSNYSPAAGRPLDLDPVLRRHPKLRLYVMHYGSPLIEEMIAILYSHPNVYVDVAQNNWGFPRAHFYRQLKQLVDAGFGKRIMFGSDQMIWPDTIPIAIETIEQAPFLTEEQKRDILYNNAARFLRLSEEEIARHHGK